MSRSKHNQTIKFGKLIEIIIEKQRNIFFKNHAENKADILIPDLLLFFEKALNEVKPGGLGLVSIYFDSTQLVIQ